MVPRLDCILSVHCPLAPDIGSSVHCPRHVSAFLALDSGPHSTESEDDSCVSERLLS